MTVVDDQRRPGPPPASATSVRWRNPPRGSMCAGVWSTTIDCMSNGESGVLIPEEARDPTRPGYGRELIERALPYQPDASTRYELAGDGVRCVIEIDADRALGRRSPQPLAIERGKPGRA